MKRLAKDMFWVNLNYLLVSLLGFLLSIFITRIGGKQEYGSFILILSLISLTTLFSVPGYRTMVIKYVSQGKEAVFKESIKYSLKVGLIFVPVLFGIGLYYLLNGDNEIAYILIFSSFINPFINSFISWQFYLRGKSRFKELAIKNGLALAFSHLALIVVYYISRSLLWSLSAYLIVTLIFYVYYCFKITKSSKGELPEDWKKQSWMLSILEYSGLLYGKADLILIGILLGPADLAIYAIVMKIGELFIQVIQNSIEAIAPKIYSGSYTYIKILSFIFPVALIVLIIGTFIGKPIIFFYGEDFRESISLIKIYLLVIPVVFASKLSSVFLIKNDLLKEINIIRIVSIIINLLSYVILIKYYGILGGVIGSILFFVVQFILNHITLLKLTK